MGATNYVLTGMILQVFTILNLLCLIPDGFPVSMGIIIVPFAKANCLMQTRVTQGTWTQTQETGASLKPRSFTRCTWKLNTLDSTFFFLKFLWETNGFEIWNCFFWEGEGCGERYNIVWVVFTVGWTESSKDLAESSWWPEVVVL